MTIIILVFLALGSCAPEGDRLPRLLVEKHESIKRINSKMMLRSQAPLLAVNFAKDTTVMSKISDMEFYTDNVNDTTGVPLSNFDDIKVIVDTTYAFSTRGFIYRPIPEITAEEKLLPMPKKHSEVMKMYEKFYERYRRETDSLKMNYVKSYPVLIYNNSNLDLHFGVAPIKIIQEALDVDKKWKPIEYTYQMPGCGIAASIIRYRLRPKHYLATATIKYEGDFKTKIRVNYLRGNKAIYSNEFVGYINRSQFNRKFAEDFLREKDYFSEGKWFEIDLSYMFHNPVNNDSK